jgi:hypothetical protein
VRRFIPLRLRPLLPPELGPFSQGRGKRSKNQPVLIGNGLREPSVIVATEIAMLLFFLPLIIFDAMLSSPKRKASEATSEKAFD